MYFFIYELCETVMEVNLCPDFYFQLIKYTLHKNREVNQCETSPNRIQESLLSVFNPQELVSQLKC